MTATHVTESAKRPRAVSRKTDPAELQAHRAADVVASGGSVAGWSFSSVSSQADVHRDEISEREKELAIQAAQKTDSKSTGEKVAAGAQKAGEAALKTPLGKDLQQRLRDRPDVKAVEEFVDSTPGKIAIGSVALAGAGVLVATSQPLPIGIPAIPLSSTVSLKPAITGPLDRPTGISLTLTISEKSAPDKKGPSSADAVRADIARIKKDNAWLTDAIEKARAEHGAAPQQPVQRDAVPGASSGAVLDHGSVDAALSGGGRPLDSLTRRTMESRFGYNFGSVRLHDGATPADAARGLQASAFTVGEDIVFGAGAYDPASAQGQHVLAHELAHVVQHNGADSVSIHRQERGPIPPLPKDVENSPEHMRIRVAIGEAKWPLVAELLNAYNIDGIRAVFAELSVGQVESIFLGAVINRKVGQDAQVATAAMASSPELQAAKSSVQNAGASVVEMVDFLRLTRGDFWDKHGLLRRGEVDKIFKSLPLETVAHFELLSDTTIYMHRSGRVGTIASEQANKVREFVPHGVAGSVTGLTARVLTDDQDKIEAAAQAGDLAGTLVPVFAAGVARTMKPGVTVKSAPPANAVEPTIEGPSGLRIKYPPNSRPAVLTPPAAAKGSPVPASTAPARRPPGSSLGVLQEEPVRQKHYPGAQELPPGTQAVDLHEGGTEVVTVRKEFYKGREVTVHDVVKTGGTWIQLHTVIEAKDATPQNVEKAVKRKLDDMWNRIHNPPTRAPARDFREIAPNTYRRVRLEEPQQLIVHIDLRESEIRPELREAAQRALDKFYPITDLPPTRVAVTGTDSVPVPPAGTP